MSRKKILNSPSTAVEDAIQGLVLVNNNLTTICRGRVVVRRDVERLRCSAKVAIVSGGGSGHEPAWAGYVGPGMATAAVCGNIFASPPSSTIYESILYCAKENPAGALVIVKNYTGDRVNFGLAIERVRAIGIKCEMVIATDDCALVSKDRSAGRRGLCGTMFLHKVAGAMAEEGKSLQEIVDVCQRINRNMGTIGVSLGSCCLPGSDNPLFTLPLDEIELGLGIHGEAGASRMPITTAKNIVHAQFDHLTNINSSSCLHLQKGDRIAVVVNNLGGTSYLELNVVAKEILHLCENKELRVERVYCGTFVTSLDMHGVSLTILKVDDDLIKYLDAPTQAPAWSKPWRSDSVTDFSYDEVDTGLHKKLFNAVTVTSGAAGAIHKSIYNSCQAIINHEEMLNNLDIGCGDGDTGTTLSQGCKAIEEYLRCTPMEEFRSPASVLSEMSSIIERSMGGTSGGLYSLLLSAAAAELVEKVSFEQCIQAFESGINAIMRYGQGQPGDRTMLDALIPSLQALKSAGPIKQRIENCCEAAKVGAESTAGMLAKSGRASYTPLSEQQRVDPGAKAVAIWIHEVCHAFLAFIDLI